MAILGEAHIIVRAITDGVENDIKRAFDQSGANDAMRKNSKAMKGNAMEALKASQAFTRLNRVGMLMQGIVGALAGGITALVSGGLIPLIAALGQAAVAGVAVISTFAAIKVGSMVAKSAMKGIGQAVSAASTGNSAYAKTLREVREEMQQLAFDAEDAALGEKRAALNLERAREELMRVQDLPPNDRARREAELAYEEADLAFRRAKDRNSDMAEEMANAGKKKGGGGGAAADPFKDLTASQKVFAQYLVTIQGKMKELREAAASGFLPLLQTQIERIMRGPAFGTLLKGYNTVGVALGEAAKNFVNALTKGNNLDNLKEFFRQTAKILPKLGTVLGNLFGAFLSVMKAAEPLTLRFVTWLTNVTGRMDKLAAVGANSGTLTTFFKKAGDMAAKLSGILKNFALGIGASFGASVGPGSGGEMLLNYLDRAAKRYKEARQSFSGRLLGKQNFKEAATSFIEISRALGKIGGAFKGLGAGAGGFFTELARSAPSLKTILQNSIKTGQAFGRLIAKVIEFIAVFSDAAQVNIFFETLSAAVAGVTALIKLIPAPVMAALGVVFGLFSAFGLIVKVLGTVKLVMKGFLVQLALTTASLFKVKVEAAAGSWAFKKLGISAEVAGKQMKASMAGNLILLALTLVVGAVMAIGDQIEKANEALRDTASAAFETGKSGAEAFQAMFAGASVIDKEIGSIENLGDSLNKLNKYRAEGNVLDGSFMSYDILGDQDFNAVNNLVNKMRNFGQVLGEMAATDLEAAQRGFKELATSSNLSRQQTASLLTESPKYREELVKQADALGINIRNLDGTVNGAKQLDFALGEGEIAIRRAAQEAENFSKKIAGAASEMINFGDAVEQNTNKGNKKVNVKGLIKTLGEQALNASKYYANLLALKGRGVGQPVIDAIIASGAQQGSAAAAALAVATDDQLDALTAQYSEVGNLTGDEMSAKLTEAGPAITAVFKQLGKDGMDSFIASLMAGDSISTAMATLMKDAILTPAQRVALLNTSQKEIIYSVDGAGNLHAKDVKTGKYLYAKGGLVRPMKFSNGTTNPLQGFGGPQSDTIPAYLSPGEFVMNASATSRFLPTLRAMNQTSFSNNRLNSTVPAAQALTPKSSNVSIVVNPAPGMNETELAQKVAVEMARQMRQGAF